MQFDQRTGNELRNALTYPIVLVLALLAAVDLLNLLGVLLQHDAWQRQGSHAAIWLVAAMMTLIGGRVIPFFTQRGLGRLEMVQPWAWLDLALLVGTLLLALLTGAGLLLQPHWGGAVLLLALGLGHGIRLQRWFDRGLLRVPLLWSLHLAYAWLAIAALGMGAWHLGWLAQPSLASHALAVGAMGGLILAMLARVSLGHTGRPLQPPPAMTWAFALLQLAALSRVALAAFAVSGLWLAALCWCLAFGLFLRHYAAMFCTARVDGHPG